MGELVDLEFKWITDIVENEIEKGKTFSEALEVASQKRIERNLGLLMEEA